MDSAGIIPDIIDSKPKSLAKVTYAESTEVHLGNELQPKQVKDQPEVTWEAENESLYTLLMVDPDASCGEVLHWLVINIPGNKVSEGQTIAEYIGSGPPEGTGLHRYVFLVFKQAEEIKSDKFISNTSREGRLSLKTRDYITKYNLGNPVAGNFYKAQYDDYVPVLHAQFK